MTSTSSKILHSLSGLSHPILRLILFSIKGHLDNYGDGGLQTALLLVRYFYCETLKIVETLEMFLECL